MYIACYIYRSAVIFTAAFFLLLGVYCGTTRRGNAPDHITSKPKGKYHSKDYSNPKCNSTNTRGQTVDIRRVLRRGGVRVGNEVTACGNWNLSTSIGQYYLVIVTILSQTYISTSE